MAKKRGGKKWWTKTWVKFAVVGLGVGIGMILWNAYGGRMGRMGLYIPAPTVKKYPAFAGTQYYS